MIMSEKLRNMSPKDKIATLFHMLTEASDAQRQDIMTEINAMLGHVPLAELEATYGIKLKQEIVRDDQGKVISGERWFEYEWEGKPVRIDVALLDRKDFEGAEPVQNPEPVRSMLSKEELADLETP